jgi:hypothetical protein
MVRPIRMGSKHRPKSLDFERIIDEGQHPKGFTAETANGTARAKNNPGWNQNIKYPSYPAVPEGAWSNSNRTGE